MARGWKNVTVSSAGPRTWSMCATRTLCGFIRLLGVLTGIMAAMAEEWLGRLSAVTEPLFAGAGALFDEYREHYGANPARGAVEQWLTELVLSDRARIYVAGRGGDARGICSVAVVPAALTLRTVWLIRDLYVSPTTRRQGLARALLAMVAEDARAAGAHRLSLRTETSNERAIELYAGIGFEALTDVEIMERLL